LFSILFKFLNCEIGLLVLQEDNQTAKIIAALDIILFILLCFNYNAKVQRTIKMGKVGMCL